jgi:hypothetical protein
MQPNTFVFSAARAVGPLALALALAACEKAEPVFLANGAPAYRLVCSLAPDNLSRCYRDAGRLCGTRGFALHDWSGRMIGLPQPNPDDREFTGSLETTELLVACRS